MTAKVGKEDQEKTITGKQRWKEEQTDRQAGRELGSGQLRKGRSSLA